MPRTYPVRPLEKTCIRCGDKFMTDTHHARKVYCTPECKRGTFTCGTCGNTFVPSKNAQGKFCSKECFYEDLVPTGSVGEHYDGYTITKVPKGTPGTKVNSTSRGRWMLTHRYVMQQHLGRPLTKSDQVHHKNGIKSDNRIENLELWNRPHPYGQRPADLLVENDQLRVEVARLTALLAEKG